MVPVEAEAPLVSETVDQSAIVGASTTAEERPKRQFLAGLLIGSLIGNHNHHGHHHHHVHHHHGRPYGGYRGNYGCVLSIVILFLKCNL